MSQLKLDSSGSGLPLYRQLAEAIRRLVDTGELQTGDRLPATRELAGQLGLNRTTVSAAYAALEESGFLEGQVGRGSFVAARKTREAEPYFAAEPLDWDTLFPAGDWARPQAASPVEISFASSRPP
ncbi:MAG TPA: GntR family transcriptional regulator, partial [Bryobacteraceae bacterium]|nr:GntR family transcriptional regulator [Bryobacteraceae bacterium]